MAIYVSNITIEQGYDFDTSFQLEDTRTNEPLYLVGATCEAQLRKSYTSSTKVSFAASVSDAETGLISITMTAAKTVTLTPGRYVYDVKIVNAGKDYKAVEGTALVRPGVTR